MKRFLNFVRVLTLSLLDFSLLLLGWWQGTKLAIEHSPPWITALISSRAWAPIAWALLGFAIAFFYLLRPLYWMAAVSRSRSKDEATPPQKS